MYFTLSSYGRQGYTIIFQGFVILRDHLLSCTPATLQRASPSGSTIDTLLATTPLQNVTARFQVMVRDSLQSQSPLPPRAGHRCRALPSCRLPCLPTLACRQRPAALSRGAPAASGGSMGLDGARWSVQSDRPSPRADCATATPHQPRRRQRRRRRRYRAFCKSSGADGSSSSGGGAGETERGVG